MSSIQAYDDAARRVVDGISELLDIGARASGFLEHDGFALQAQQLREEILAAADGQVRVVVAGEFKSGKSALINALLGAPLAGSDPIETSSIPIEFRHGSEFAALAELASDRDPADASRVAIDGRDLRRLAVTTSPAVDGWDVRALRVSVDAPLLASGLRIVDTPSVSGGLTSAASSIVIGELVQSHAWIFVTDASQELTAPELELIKVGASLCTSVLVVETKCDIAPQWQRITDLDREHLAALELEPAPVVIPTSAALRHAARRLNRPELDDESGLPLLTWTLTRSIMTTARLDAARQAAAVTAGELEALDHSLTTSIDAMRNVDERDRLLAQSADAKERCQRLLAEMRTAIERAMNDFRKRTRRDLEDRIAVVRRQSLDDLEELDSERDWPKLERRVQADVNRLLATHLAAITAQLGDVLAALAEELRLEAEALDIIDRFAISDQVPDHLVTQLDPPSMPQAPASKLSSMLVPARVGITGGSGVGLGISSGLLTGAVAVAGVVLVPVAAIGAGWWLRQRSRDQAAVPWRQQATAELTRFLADCHQVIGRCSEDMRDEILSQLPRLVEERLRQTADRFASEHERLQALAADRGNIDESEIADRLARRDDVRLLATHARRLVHKLHKPTLVTAHDNRPPIG
ncbi:MAG: dynamin family protein [Actinomycetota bacterium]